MNIPDKTGQTPLFAASCCNSAAAIKYLIEKKADPSIRDMHGVSALEVGVVRAMIHPHAAGVVDVLKEATGMEAKIHPDFEEFAIRYKLTNTQ